MEKSLDQFLSVAERISDVARYDVLEIGLVWLNPSGLVIALRASLSRKEWAPEPSDFHSSRVSAARVVLDRERLEEVLGVMGSGGEIAETFGLEGSIHLSAAGVVPGWRFETGVGFRSGRAACLRMASTDLQNEIGRTAQDQRTLDTVIAEASRFEFSRLSRLVKHYTGLDWSENSQSSDVVIASPWPVENLFAKVAGNALEVDIEGMAGLSRSDFILNVEGLREDRRIEPDEVQWVRVAHSDRRELNRVRILRAPIGPERVNLFLQGVPEIALSSEVRHERPLALSPDVAPSRPGDAGELRLTGVRLRNYRLLRDVDLDVSASALSVLVGPNQSGKSTLMDALDLLRMGAQGKLSEALVRRRGGLGSVISRGGERSPLELEVSFAHPRAMSLRYDVCLEQVGTFDYRVTRERMTLDGEAVLSRDGAGARFGGMPLTGLNERELFLSTLHASEALHFPGQMAAAVSGLAVYPFFRIGAAWIDPDGATTRLPQPAQPGARLEPTGANLTSALFSLKEDEESWALLLEATRLAFPSFRGLDLRAVAKGTLALTWLEEDARFEASELSDGTIQYLALCCALLQRGSAAILIDEPEKHLHPRALHRIVGLAQSVSSRQPVILATQSDALISMLDETPEAVVVAQREGAEARLFRPDLDELRRWLEDFSLGEMRRELETWSTPAS